MSRADKIEQTALRILGAGIAAWFILAARNYARRKGTEDYFAEKNNGESTDGVGLVGDRTFERRPYRSWAEQEGRNLERLYAYEPRLNRKVWVGTIDHNKRYISPTHGYFYPHKYGKLMQKLAYAMGYAFNNR